MGGRVFQVMNGRAFNSTEGRVFQVMEHGCVSPSNYLYVIYIRG